MRDNEHGVHIKFQGEWRSGILGLSVLPLCRPKSLVFAWFVGVGGGGRVLYVSAPAQKELSEGFKTAKH